LQTQRKTVILRIDRGRAVCPVCGRRMQVEILPSTVLVDFPLFCKKCGQTTVVHTESLSRMSLS